MKLVSGGRQSGKTVAAIKAAADTYSYLVVRSHAEAFRVAKVAESEGLSIPFPITFDEFCAGRFGGGVRGFVVDGVEALIQRFANGVPIHLATFDDEQPATPKPTP
jgi:hypothetical protein